MFKIKSNLSLKISFAIAALAQVGLVAAAFLLPFAVRLFLHSFNIVYMNRYAATLALGYTALLPVAIADALLLSLLSYVRSARVFSAASVSRLRGISWCCFCETAILAVGVFFVHNVTRLVIIPAAFAACFLGVVLRVVKNVIEQATEIKSENDLTI